ncbi:hypothetical protein FS837_002028 [Tulasnella sp. UAMH 9824]|nr:hypothetical protein FS837_002028 [Tulasnella sp. UAMH 9824]
MTEAGPSTASTSTATPSTATEPRPLAKGTSGRVSGKWWKEEKKPFKRSHLPPVLKSKSWEKQKEATNKEKAIRQLIKEQKEEREQADKAFVVTKEHLVMNRRKQAIVERRKTKEEKERLERMREKMSAKKLERLKKKLGRTKKINH